MHVDKAKRYNSVVEHMVKLWAAVNLVPRTHAHIHTHYTHTS